MVHVERTIEGLGGQAQVLAIETRVLDLVRGWGDAGLAIRMHTLEGSIARILVTSDG
jgi:hypothetical protein